MAGKKIKFALKMADGTQVRHLEDLRGHIKNTDDFKKIVEYFLDDNNTLVRWLLQDERKYEKEAMALRSLDKNDPDFTCKLCKAIGIDYTPSESVNVALIEHEMRIMKALEKVTSDNAVIANAGCTASNQSELDFLIENGKKIIYLWGDSFKLPLKHNISYIGILGKPSVNIELPNLEAVESYGINFENVELPESIRKAKEEVDEKIIQLFSELPDLEVAESYGITFENVKLPEKFNPNPFKNAKVGDIVQMGRYPQTANGEFKPIEWQVLAIENNKILVISKYGLEARRFYYSRSNNWKNSEIRQWLNGEFYNKAFTDQEKKSIKSSNLLDVGTKSKKSFNLSDVDTIDNVFLLSKEEAEKYFAYNYKEARRCKVTEYAFKNGAYLYNGYSWWWLRSPHPTRSDNVYYVNSDGSIHGCVVGCDDLVVRPALWINLDCEQDILDSKDDPLEQLSNYNNHPQRQNSVNPNPFKNAKVGEIVKFGNYPQTANGDIQPIEWQVLSKGNNKMLVISKYGLDARRFDSRSNNWKNSEIRQWLNNDFYKIAFNEKEKKYINSSNLSDVGTTDNVFLLSGDWDGNGNESRRCKATEYAVKNGAWVADSSYGDNAGYSWWWLRSPSPSSIFSVYFVLSGGGIRDSLVDCDLVVVRPTLWINSYKI